MQWIEVKIIFSSDDVSLALDLISDAFFNLKAKGVVIDDPRMAPAEDWAPDAVVGPDRPAVTGYFPANDQFDEHRLRLEESIISLADSHLSKHSIEYRPINEEDWAESWKAYFKPQRISPRIVVKPTWQSYEAKQDQLVIEIDPGMAFGTGTHPTTSLCIRLLEEHLCPGDAVLDVGTGSGILLITAAKLGASQLSGIDSDPIAVDVTRKNLIQNNIDLSAVHLTLGNLVQGITNTYDVVVANILAEVIIELLDDVVDMIQPNGLFICSGIIKAFQTGVMEKMTQSGLHLCDQRQDGDWVALVGRRDCTDP